MDILLLDTLEDEPTEYTRIKNPVTGQWGTRLLAHSSLSLFYNELPTDKKNSLLAMSPQVSRS